MTVQDELKMARSPEPGLELVLSLLLTREVITEVFDTQLFTPFGITDQQFNVLRILSGGPPEGYTLAELRRRLLHRNADAVRLVERMVKQGLVARVPHPEDRRAALVTLTEEGRALQVRLAEPHEALCRKIECLMPSEDLERISALLDKARQALRSL